MLMLMMLLMMLLLCTKRGMGILSVYGVRFWESVGVGVFQLMQHTYAIHF